MEIPEYMTFAFRWIWIVYPAISILFHSLIERQIIAISCSALAGLAAIGVLIAMQVDGNVQDPVYTSIVLLLPLMFVIELA